MKKIVFLVLLLVLCMELQQNTAFAFSISAESAILYEPITQRVLYEKNANQKMGIASTTKILTGITAIENGNLADIVTVSKNAAEVEGSSVWLEEGEKQTLEDLLYGLLLSSGNDAAVAIAEHVGGSVENFAILMNQTAKIAGAHNANFVNPNGLDAEQHYATALDMAKITAYAMQNLTFRKIVSTEEYAIPWQGHQWNRTLKNHNKLLRLYEGCIGVKTGFTKKSGRCLVSTAERNSIELIAVTLKAPNDWEDHTVLLDYGFSVLSQKTVVQKGECAGNIPVSGGESSEVSTYFAQDIVLPLLETDQTEVKVFCAKNTEAPVLKDASVGYAEVYVNGILVTETEILAQNGCEKLFKPQMLDYFRQLILAGFSLKTARQK